MTDQNNNQTGQPDSKTGARESMLSGGAGRGGRGRVLAGGALLLGTGAAAWFLLVPPGETPTAPDTSQPAKVQDPQPSSGVDTNLPMDQTEEPETNAPAPTQMAPAQVPDSGDGGAADRARIADLERRINELLDAKGDNPDVAALMEQQRKLLEEAFQREREDAEARYQQQLAELLNNTSTGDGGMSDAERDARARLEEERARRAAIAEAQIMSEGIVIDASTARAGSPSQSGASAAGGSGSGNGAGRELTSNESFMAQAATQSYETVSATRIAAPDRTIVQGTTLNAVLETAVSTELPGVIRAVVTDNVMSYDGTNVLLPQGTRLIGSYNSDVSVVQGRVQMAWNRAVTPEGVSVELGGYGADALGMSGQAGTVDTRFRQRFGSAALISLMGAAPELLVDRSTDGRRSDWAEDAGDDITNASGGALDEYLSAGPVIYIDQGTYLTVIVNRDLVL
ncbi:MAG: TrbI/VirB10 family protein [Rhodobacterales bacterium]|nr:TrbI/VirB10 family protein [Rhodobacterales bacterium]